MSRVGSGTTVGPQWDPKQAGEWDWGTLSLGTGPTPTGGSGAETVAQRRVSTASAGPVRQGEAQLAVGDLRAAPQQSSSDHWTLEGFLGLPALPAERRAA